MLFQILTRYNEIGTRAKTFLLWTSVTLTRNLSFLTRFYRLNDLMWQDGLLIDFLQKKVADKWIRRFLICSSYLFSERVLFKFVVRFYIDSIVWPSTVISVFEFSNVTSLLSATVLTISFLILLFNLNYLYVILF